MRRQRFQRSLQLVKRALGVSYLTTTPRRVCIRLSAKITALHTTISSNTTLTTNGQLRRRMATSSQPGERTSTPSHSGPGPPDWSREMTMFGDQALRVVVTLSSRRPTPSRNSYIELLYSRSTRNIRFSSQRVYYRRSPSWHSHKPTG